MIKCSNCGSDNKEDIKICLTCGHHLNNDFETINVQFYKNLDFENLDNLSDQIRDFFFKSMKFRIESELDPKGYQKYFDLFHSSGFYKKYDIRVKQLAEEVQSIHTKHDPLEEAEIINMLDNVLDLFLDYFIIVYCKTLHNMELPEAILRQGSIQQNTMNLDRLIFDYLDFENEKDKVYNDFLKMPEKKLKNAKAAFLFAEGDEKLFFICDQTIFGSCKEGFAMTNEGLYWKPHFNEPGQVKFRELETIKREGEWIVINGQFFNVNKTMNYKMILLLKKLKKTLS